MAPACGFAAGRPLPRSPPSGAKFRAIVIIYNRGAPGPAITLTKSCGRRPRRCVPRCLGQNAGATPANFADIRSRENSSARASAETYNYRGILPVISVGRCRACLRSPPSSGKGRFSFSVCYLPCNLFCVQRILRLALSSSSICGAAPRTRISFDRFQPGLVLLDKKEESRQIFSYWA